MLRLMRTLFAVLVALVFGCMPTLAIASPATASPPSAFVCVSPEPAHVETAHESNMRSDITLDSETRCAGMPVAGGDSSTSTRSTTEPGYPLRE